MAEKIGESNMQEDREIPAKIEVTLEEITKAKFDPIQIGRNILEQFGYGVFESGDKNGEKIEVVDKNGQPIYKKEFSK